MVTVLLKHKLNMRLVIFKIKKEPYRLFFYELIIIIITIIIKAKKKAVKLTDTRDEKPTHKIFNMVHFIETMFYLNLLADALIFIIAPRIFLLLKK